MGKRMTARHPNQRVRDLGEWRRRYLRPAFLPAMVVSVAAVWILDITDVPVVLSMWMPLVAAHLLISARIYWWKGEMFEALLLHLMVACNVLATAIWYYHLIGTLL